MAAERVQKILVRAGICSRRAGEELIRQGRVTINGVRCVELGTKADVGKDVIAVSGHGRVELQPLCTIALNKPKNIVTTLNDPEKRQTVMDVIAASRAFGKRRFESELPRVVPVGRLDFDAEGLLLLTNDGDLAQRLTAPRFHVQKTYLVKVKGVPDERQLGRLARGIRLAEPTGRHSRRTLPAEVRIHDPRAKRPKSLRLRSGQAGRANRPFSQTTRNSWLELGIHEGRNHQIKRMCEAIGHPVLRIVRIAIGALALGDLPPGAWRFLSDAELAGLSARPKH